MPRMIELIRQAAVPASLMRAAARGALSLPLPEMVEVLVQLTTMPLFAEQAQLTLAGWDAALLAPVLSSPEAPPEVLEYFLSPTNLRSSLLLVLLENPAVGEERLARLAAELPARDLDIMLNSRRASLPLVTEALLGRADVAGAKTEDLQAELARLRAGGEGECLSKNAPAEAYAEVAGDVNDPAPAERAGEGALEPGSGAVDPETFLREHAEEIRAAEGGAFQLIGSTREEQAEIAAACAAQTARLAAHALAQGPRERSSAIQKVSRLTVGGRVQLALKGTREERLILVRDGVKVVANAVLHSPRVTEQDVEMYASMRNVDEIVLRGIAANRKFMRRYAVKRVLTANPRCPIEVALSLVKELLVSDLDNLSKNRNVSDSVRQFAWKMLRTKRDKKD